MRRHTLGSLVVMFLAFSVFATGHVPDAEAHRADASAAASVDSRFSVVAQPEAPLVWRTRDSTGSGCDLLCHEG
jgi:hypothetical protein